MNQNPQTRIFSNRIHTQPKQMIGRKLSNNSQQVGLLSSDGLGDSCSGSSRSSGSISDTVCMQQKQQLNSDNHVSGVGAKRYISSDGSIFTLTPSLTTNNHNEPQAYQQQQNYSHISRDLLLESSSSPNSSTGKYESPERRRLFGNNKNSNSAVAQQHRRLQFQVHQQLQKIYGNQIEKRNLSNKSVNHNEQLTERQKFLMKRHQIQQAKRIVEQNQFKNQTQGTEPSTTMSNINHLDSQTIHEYQQSYESINRNDVGMQEDIYDINGNLPVQPIRKDGLAPRKCVHTIQVEQFENDNDQEEDLLLPEMQPAVAKRAIVDRKSQLESLHYATVTAAALLNATANAAAAFVATEKQLDPKPQLPRQPAPRPARVENNAIYSDAYQYIQRKPRSQSEPYKNVETSINRTQKVGPEQQIYQPNQNIYANTVEPNQFYSNGSKDNLIYGFNKQKHPNQQLLLQHYQQLQAQMAQKARIAPQANLGNHQGHFNGPINQPNLADPSVNYQQNQLLRLQQQLHHQRILQQKLAASQLGVQQAPAIAVLHKPVSKNRTDVVGKVLLNNPNQARQTAIDLSRYVQSNSLIGPNFKKVANGVYNNNQSLALVTQQSRSRVYSEPALFVSVPSAIATRTNPSLIPNLPVDLNLTKPNLRPIGCLERICRINLTMFWWALLLVSCAFVGSVISIYRYIF